jgi:hypothetical protein
MNEAMVISGNGEFLMLQVGFPFGHCHDQCHALFLVRGHGLRFWAQGLANISNGMVVLR